MNLTVVAIMTISLIYSLIIAWETISNMIDRKNIKKFLPFLFFSIILSFYAAFSMFQFFFQWGWFFLEFSIFVAIIWIFMAIREENNEYN